MSQICLRASFQHSCEQCGVAHSSGEWTRHGRPMKWWCCRQLVPRRWDQCSTSGSTSRRYCQETHPRLWHINNTFLPPPRHAHTHTAVFPSRQKTIRWLTFISCRPSLVVDITPSCLSRGQSQTLTFLPWGVYSVASSTRHPDTTCLQRLQPSHTFSDSTWSLEEPGIKPWTFRLLNSSLSLLSRGRPRKVQILQNSTQAR